MFGLIALLVFTLVAFCFWFVALFGLIVRWCLHWLVFCFCEFVWGFVCCVGVCCVEFGVALAGYACCLWFAVSVFIIVVNAAVFTFGVA